jgi:hypothetical protein
MRNVFLFWLFCCSLSLAQEPPVAEHSDQRWEASSRWETIRWQHDAASALRESSSSGKPLMVFLVVNYEGEAGADKV